VGIVGWGWSTATPGDAQKLVGKKLHEVFDPRAGTVDAFLMFDFPLWDLAGRVSGESVHAVLGDAGCNPVPVYDGSIYFDDLDPGTGHDRGVQPVLNAVAAGLDVGFRAFKVKLGRGFRWMGKQAGLKRDIEVVHAIRKLIGADMRLLIDANNGYTPGEAREVMRQAGDCEIFWFEEPFPEDRGECLAFKEFIQDGGWRTLIGDGEASEQCDTEFTTMVRAGGIDVVQFDLRYYTLTKWIQYLPIIAETKTFGAPHSWGSHVGGFYVAQYARGCPYFLMGEIDTMTLPAVIADGYKLVDGMMTVPDTPGFGLELDQDAFAATRQSEGSWAVK
jgi:L-alanine-DL-glutamate epimerase-like enolase superfamily enzyme